MAADVQGTDSAIQAATARLSQLPLHDRDAPSTSTSSRLGDAADVLHAFFPEAPSRLRTLAVVRMASEHEAQQQQRQKQQSQTQSLAGPSLSASLHPVLLAALAADSPKHVFASSRLLAALYPVAPHEAHTLFCESEFGGSKFVQALLKRCPIKDTRGEQQAQVTDSDSTNEVLAFVAAELFCAATSHAESRRAITAFAAEDASSDPSANKIVEIDDDGANVGASRDSRVLAAPVSWLEALFQQAYRIQLPEVSAVKFKTGLLAALALHKLTASSSEEHDKQPDVNTSQRSDSGTNAEVQNAQSSSKSDSEDVDECPFFFYISGAFVDCGTKQDAIAKGLDKDSGPLVFHTSTTHEFVRLCQMSALEGLAFHAIQPAFVQACTAAHTLFGLRALGKLAANAGDVKSRYQFPARRHSQQEGGQVTSYEMDSALKDGKANTSVPDTAMQFAIVTVLEAITSYPAVRSSEQQQIDKLRRMASAKAPDMDEDPRISVTAVEERVAEVIEACGVETLVSAALSRIVSPEAARDNANVNPSAGVRRAVSAAFLNLTTRQDKRQRGIIIQQGGARALLALSNDLAARILTAQNKVFVSDASGFACLQALAHLLISENPAIVLSNPAEAIPALGLLFLHKQTSKLQRFEAALALTNIASLGPQLTERVALCSFSKAIVNAPSAADFVGAGRDEAVLSEQSGDQAGKSIGLVGRDKVCVADVLHERVFLEDNEMSRCASLELLCNLLASDLIFRQWSGEADDEEGARMTGNHRQVQTTQGRTAQSFTFLAALCAPCGVNEEQNSKASSGRTGDTALKMRLAAGGALAMLVSSPAACERLLSAKPRILNRICKLIDPGTAYKREKIIELGDSEREHSDEDGDDDEDLAGANDAQCDAQDCALDPAGALHARWQLALRGVTIIECLLQHVDFAQSSGGMRDVTAFKRVLVAAGAVEAIKSVAQQGAKLLKQQQPQPRSDSNNVAALQMQITKQALGVLQTAQKLNLLNR